MPRKDCRKVQIIHPFLCERKQHPRALRTEYIASWKKNQRRLKTHVRPALASCWYLDLLSNDSPFAGSAAATFGLVSLYFSRQALYYLAVIAFGDYRLT